MITPSPVQIDILHQCRVNCTYNHQNECSTAAFRWCLFCWESLPSLKQSKDSLQYRQKVDFLLQYTHYLWWPRLEGWRSDTGQWNCTPVFFTVYFPNETFRKRKKTILVSILHVVGLYSIYSITYTGSRKVVSYPFPTPRVCGVHPSTRLTKACIWSQGNNCF